MSDDFYFFIKMLLRSANQNKDTGYNRLASGFWWLTPLSTIFKLSRAGQFYWWRKQEYREKTTDLPPKKLPQG
jgi:hypothetical protein